jgi:Family of unknown function (DUF6152)
MKRFVVGFAVLVGAVLVLRGTPALAHHSFAIVYLEQDTIEIEGEVVEFQYKNPHAWVMVQGTEKAGVGGPKIFAAEWVSVSQLDRMEIDKTFFKIGDPVRVWASPNKNPLDNRVRLKRIERTSDGWKWQGNRGAVR